jgi:hypothetical protein
MLISASVFVDTLGDGLWMVGGGLFFVRSQHFAVAAVGAGLTIAGLVGLPAGIRLARVADRRGPRGTYLALTLTQSAAFVALVVSRSFLVFVLASAVAASANQGAQATRSGIVRSFGGAEAVRFRARLHVITNLGISAGAALAGIAIAVNTRDAYVSLMLVDAATFGLAGLLLRGARITPTASVPAVSRRSGAIRDLRYVAVAAADGLLDLEFIVSGFLLPLWVVLHTTAPRWLASPLLLLNTAIVVLFQVRFAKAATEPVGAAGSARRGSLALGGAAILFGLSGGVPALAAAGLLVAAMCLHSLGELMHASGSFGLSYGLAPEHTVSEYQAVWSLGMGLARALGPAVLTVVCLRGGLAGWIALGVAFAVTGACIPRLAALASASRPHALGDAAPDVQPARR